MASTVKAGLDAIAAQIENSRRILRQAKDNISIQENVLNTLPATYKTVLDEVAAYTPTGAFETLAKDEVAKLTVDFIALRDAATVARTGIADITEF